MALLDANHVEHIDARLQVGAILKFFLEKYSIKMLESTGTNSSD